MKEQTETQDDIIPGTEGILYMIHHELRDELATSFRKLKEVLKDDIPLYNDLKDSIVLVGKTMESSQFNSIIHYHYANAIDNAENRTEKQAVYSFKSSLIGITDHIVSLLNGNKDIKDKISQLPLEDQNDVNYCTRMEIEEDIYNIVKCLDYPENV